MDTAERKLVYFLSSFESIQDWTADCVLLQLPESEQLRAVGLFCAHGERFFCGLVDDVTKLLHRVWTTTDPGSPFVPLCRQLADRLRALPMVTRCRYPDWHLCGLYPLLNNDGTFHNAGASSSNEGLTLLEAVCQKPYDDAQDMMMMALFYLDPFHAESLATVKRIFRYWRTHQNIMLGSSGTGCWYELNVVLRRYEQKGWTLDDEMQRLVADRDK